jgi:hypothetical protein
MEPVNPQDQTSPSDTRAATDARTIPVRLPTGKVFSMPAWMASAMIEGLLRHDRQVYARHMMAIKTGEDVTKPGRRAQGSDPQ